MTDSSCNCNCTTPQYTLTLNAQGPQGATGSQGVAGFSPVVSVVQDTGSTYQLSITSAEGTILTPNLKSNLPSGGTTGTYLAGLTGDSPLWTNFATTVLSSALAIDGSNATGTLTLAPTDILLNPTDKAMYKGSELATVTNVSNEASLRTTADTTLQNQITANTMALTEKQDTLTAGSNISISGNTISCTVDTTNFVTTNTAQTITSDKVFSGGRPQSYYKTAVVDDGNNATHYTEYYLYLDPNDTYPASYALRTVISYFSNGHPTSKSDITTHHNLVNTGYWGGITGTITNQTDLQTALNAKQNTLTFDTTPTSGSTNPVTSGGVYTFVNTAITNAITTAIGGSY